MLCMFGNDEAYYARAAGEIANGEVRQGLWTKALAEAGYDEPRARARYLKLRVRAMKAEAVAGSRFMAGVAKTLRVSVVFGIAGALLVGLVLLGVVGIAAAKHYGWLETPQVAEAPRLVPQQGRAEEVAELDRLITQIERDYPALNPASASFDKERTDQVVVLWGFYEREGYSRANALLKAVKAQGGSSEGKSAEIIERERVINEREQLARAMRLQRY